MSNTKRSLAVVLGTAVLVLSACGAGGADQAPPTSPAAAGSQGAVPTADQLASVLLTSDDLQGTWRQSRGTPGDLSFCPEASMEASLAGTNMPWQASVQFDTTKQVPGASTEHPVHSVTVAEWLLADDPTRIQSIFTALRQGTEACFGPVTIDKRAAVSSPMAVPELGDDRFGEDDTYRMGEPGNPQSANLRGAIMRDGPVLMLVSIYEAAQDAAFTPLLSQNDVDTIITAAAANLP